MAGSRRKAPPLEAGQRWRSSNGRTMRDIERIDPSPDGLPHDREVHFLETRILKKGISISTGKCSALGFDYWRNNHAAALVKVVPPQISNTGQDSDPGDAPAQKGDR